MTTEIPNDAMVFFSEGGDGVGAVRDVTDDALTVYVENFGEFHVPRKAVKAVHDGKVVLDRDQVGEKLLRAVAHSHDSEDPRLVG
jgi:hypothetical protein